MANLQLTSLTLSLRLIKDETAQKQSGVIKFSNHTYLQVVDALLQNDHLDGAVLKEYSEKYLNIYYDLQYYFLLNAAYFFLSLK
jgi:hypothetical protein